MTTYNTGNPVPSVDVRDLYDNAENLDNFSNAAGDFATDRLGVSRETLQGIRNASQYQVIGAYAAGLQFTSYNQVFSYSGEFYAPSAGLTLPYTTTGVGAAEIATFRSVGDAVLRGDLADPDGAELVGYRSRDVYEKLGDVINVKDHGALFDGSDETARLQAAINLAIATGSRHVRIDGTLYAPGTLVNHSNVYFVGAGKLTGVYRRSVSTLNDHPLGINNINPSKHLQAFTKAAAPVVVLVGDSQSTYSIDNMGRPATLAATLDAKIRQENPGKTITFVNRAIAGQTWTTFNTKPPSVDTGLYPWYTDPMADWLPYIESLNPDLVILAFGINDSFGFQAGNFTSAINKINAWTKKPDIVFVTPLSPSMQPVAGFEDRATEAYQEGCDANAGYVRRYAERFGHGYIDLNRYWNIMRDGRDTLRTTLERVVTDAVPPAGAYTATEKVRDFSMRLVLTGAALDEPSGPIAIRVGSANDDQVRIRKSGGNFRLEFFTTPGNNYFNINTTTPVPAGTFEINISKAGNVFRFGGENTPTGADIYVEHKLLGYDAEFFPQAGHVVGGFATGPFSSITYSKGTFSRYLPQITDNEMWGSTSFGGGLGFIHPSSLGVAKVMVPAVAAADFRVDLPAGYYSHPSNPVANGYFGADFNTTGSAVTRFGNIGSGNVVLMTAGVDRLTFSSTRILPATNDAITLGDIPTRFMRAYLSRLSVDDLPVYADNAAAVAGGQPLGEFYRTATGVVMVRF